MGVEKWGGKSPPPLEFWNSGKWKPVCVVVVKPPSNGLKATGGTDDRWRSKVSKVGRTMRPCKAIIQLSSHPRAMTIGLSEEEEETCGHRTSELVRILALGKDPGNARPFKCASF